MRRSLKSSIFLRRILIAIVTKKKFIIYSKENDCELIFSLVATLVFSLMSSDVWVTSLMKKSSEIVSIKSRIADFIRFLCRSAFDRAFNCLANCKILSQRIWMSEIRIFANMSKMNSWFKWRVILIADRDAIEESETTFERYSFVKLMLSTDMKSQDNVYETLNKVIAMTKRNKIIRSIILWIINEWWNNDEWKLFNDVNLFMIFRHVIILVTINVADHKLIFFVLIIQRQRLMQNWVQFELFAETLIKTSENEFINDEIMIDWFKHFILHINSSTNSL